MSARIRYCGTAIVLALALLAAASAQVRNKPAQTHTAHTVLIKDFAFVPDHVTVSAGDTVVWKNEDIVPHTATADTKFDSKNLNSGQSWSFVARQKGSYPYVCTYHPYMKGELIVK